jgi:hypothetical protein
MGGYNTPNPHDVAMKYHENALQGGIYQVTIRQRLVQKRDQCQVMLDQINLAIKSLDDNPEVEKVVESLKRVGEYM